MGTMIENEVWKWTKGTSIGFRNCFMTTKRKETFCRSRTTSENYLMTSTNSFPHRKKKNPKKPEHSAECNEFYFNITVLLLFAGTR